MDFDLIRDLIYWGVTITHAISCQTTKFVSDLRQVGGFFPEYSGFPHQ
jgi:hypothetical protein